MKRSRCNESTDLPVRSVVVAGIVEVVGLVSLGEIIAYVVDMMEWAFGLFELGDDVGPHLSGDRRPHRLSDLGNLPLQLSQVGLFSA